MSHDNDVQESLFRATEAASELAKRIGHAPLLGDTLLNDVLEPLLPPIHRRPKLCLPDTPPELVPIVVTYGDGGPDPLDLFHDIHDPSARAIIADLLYRPAKARAESAYDDFLAGPDDDDDSLEYGNSDEFDLSEYFPSLHAYLDMLAVQDVPTELGLLWELHAAGATAHRQRLLSVCEQLLARHSSPINRTIACHAMFDTLADLGVGIYEGGWVRSWLVAAREITLTTSR